MISSEYEKGGSQEINNHKTMHVRRSTKNVDHVSVETYFNDWNELCLADSAKRTQVRST